jgi:hypothetical protein
MISAPRAEARSTTPVAAVTPCKYTPPQERLANGGLSELAEAPGDVQRKFYPAFDLAQRPKHHTS